MEQKSVTQSVTSEILSGSTNQANEREYRNSQHLQHRGELGYRHQGGEASGSDSGLAQRRQRRKQLSRQETGSKPSELPLDRSVRVQPQAIQPISKPNFILGNVLPSSTRRTRRTATHILPPQLSSKTSEATVIVTDEQPDRFRGRSLDLPTMSQSNLVANKSSYRDRNQANPNRPRLEERAGGKNILSTTVTDGKISPKDSFQKPLSNRRSSSMRSRSFAPSGSEEVKNQNVSRPVSPVVYVLRMLIVGVGIGAIAGTFLAVLDPATRISQLTPPTRDRQAQAAVEPSIPSLPPPPAPLKLIQEIAALKSQLQALVKKNPKLQPGAFFVDLDTGAYFDWEANSTFSAASTIKLPVLIAFFQDVDAGKVRLDEQLILKKELIGDGSGDIQYKKLGSKFTALEIVTKMIIISDNTATNMIIERLGGADNLNKRFQSWGLTATVINNPLPDLEGTNTTTPKELGSLMGMINHGDLVSPRSRDRILAIMQRTMTNTLLPKGLGAGATIAHKTGDIGSLVADVGLIDMPNGKRYIAAVMVKRPHNNPQAQELIRQLSRSAYKFFSESQPLAASNSKPKSN